MVFAVKTYDLIGKTIYVATERPDLKVIKGEHGQQDRFVDEDGQDGIVGPNTKLVDTLMMYKKSIIGLDDIYLAKDRPEYLPYFADVTEDLPGSCKFEPKTYKNCQLMTETHGAYLQFFDHQTKEVLRIAINSNSYSPLKKNS